LLAALIAAKPTGAFAAYAGRIRLVLCAESSLNDLADAGEFNELLLMRAGAMILRVPALAQRKEDLPSVARAVMRRVSPGLILDDATCAWIESQPWPGDFLQLHRTLELAVRNTGGKSVTSLELAAATPQEAAFKDPLFHELLPEKIALAQKSPGKT
jgi:transcriptional regulator of acetoin/glycerol metabolism